MTISEFEPERFRSAAYTAVIDTTAASGALVIPASCIDIMNSAAEAGYPLEVCGLLVGKLDSSGWRVSDVRAVANLNTDRAADRFQLDPAAYQQIDRELRGSGEEIIGVYHSHPDCPARPSPTDMDSAWEGFVYPIISVCAGKCVGLACWSVNAAGNQFQAVEVISEHA